MRGATVQQISCRVEYGCFNPHAACAARLYSFGSSISKSLFQSTRRIRGATRRPPQQDCPQRVSIHAPHARRDAFRPMRYTSFHRFNPRAACAARPGIRQSIFSLVSFNPRAACAARRGRRYARRLRGLFQSTRRMRGATCSVYHRLLRDGVSIHAPHARRDRHVRDPS